MDKREMWRFPGKTESGLIFPPVGGIKVSVFPEILTSKPRFSGSSPGVPFTPSVLFQYE